MKLGLVDYFLDEFHANNYPAWIAEQSGGEITAAYAYAMADSPKGGMTTDQWCGHHGIQKLDTIEELCEKSDGIIVLSPDHPEKHEELCRLPMQSGKRVYVDKTFAPAKEIAERIFALGDAHGTPCYSASALRFVPEYRELAGAQIENIGSRGPGPLEGYSIHQIEPVVALMGADIARVQFTGTEKYPAYICEYSDGRRATMSHHGWGYPFSIAADFSDGTAKAVTVQSDLFAQFIKELVDFFRTGEVKVPHEDTIAVIAVREAAIKAAKKPGAWMAL
ncbi:MAG: hypothetical protein FWH02_02845 [Oscillospiraceae bacterium]|nr:hypothetical protein [Oscillospiraceae bacterium]